ncbi:MAG: hypothetical protein IJ224_09795 [Lachnospiraceae bacterium]|nr:hypothetical protein [Lachnospiraceae bacterium]
MSGQRDFLNELKIIQDVVVNVMLSNEGKYNDTEDLLIDTTYETLYKILELIDGYGVNKKKYEVKDTINDEIINKKTSIHNMCEESLLHTEI